MPLFMKTFVHDRVTECITWSTDPLSKKNPPHRKQPTSADWEWQIYPYCEGLSLEKLLRAKAVIPLTPKCYFQRSSKKAVSRHAFEAELDISNPKKVASFAASIKRSNQAQRQTQANDSYEDAFETAFTQLIAEVDASAPRQLQTDANSPPSRTQRGNVITTASAPPAASPKTNTPPPPEGRDEEDESDIGNLPPVIVKGTPLPEVTDETDQSDTGSSVVEDLEGTVEDTPPPERKVDEETDDDGGEKEENDMGSENGAPSNSTPLSADCAIITEKQYKPASRKPGPQRQPLDPETWKTIGPTEAQLTSLISLIRKGLAETPVDGLHVGNLTKSTMQAHCLCIWTNCGWSGLPQELGSKASLQTHLSKIRKLANFSEIKAKVQEYGDAERAVAPGRATAPFAEPVTLSLPRQQKRAAPTMAAGSPLPSSNKKPKLNKTEVGNHLKKIAAELCALADALDTIEQGSGEPE